MVAPPLSSASASRSLAIICSGVCFLPFIESSFWPLGPVRYSHIRWHQFLGAVQLRPTESTLRSPILTVAPSTVSRPDAYARHRRPRRSRVPPPPPHHVRLKNLVQVQIHHL